MLQLQIRHSNGFRIQFLTNIHDCVLVFIVEDLIHSLILPKYFILTFDNSHFATLLRGHLASFGVFLDMQTKIGVSRI